jgi:hypothetical protein
MMLLLPTAAANCRCPVMSQWFRVFGSNDVQPAPAALLAELRRLGVEPTGNFRGDDLGWFSAELTFDPDAAPLRLERYLTIEDEIRAELSTWAAWLESAGESGLYLRLMQQVIDTRQLYTLHHPIEEAGEDTDDPRIESLCVRLCQFLARETAGIYQADHQGFFAADGTLLAAE